jgi:mono/diheme cytochrome c family protein
MNNLNQEIYVLSRGDHMKWILATACLLLTSVALAHWGHEKPGMDHQLDIKHNMQMAVQVTNVLAKINADYQARVKPIFQQKCADCHSNTTKFPWYYHIPGIHWYMDSDIREAHQHLDIANDFPFKGHGTISEDLKAIIDDTNEGDMPPWLYRVAHGATLTPSERQIIVDWAQKSQQSMGNSGLR